MDLRARRTCRVNAHRGKLNNVHRGMLNNVHIMGYSKVAILSIEEKDKITTIQSAKKPEEAQPSLISLPRLIPLGTAKHPVGTPNST